MAVVPRIIDAAWRRRYLLVVPLLIMIPVSIAAALLFPGGYVARSLMLLQETAGNNPLAKEATALPSDRMRERVSALRALLASDFVLGQALEDLGGDAYSSKQRASKIQELRQAVSVDLIGGDILEFRLSGSTAEGLGRQLEIVTSRLMETLLAQGAMSVGEILINKRQQELEAAERQNAALKKRMADALPDTPSPENETLSSQIIESDKIVHVARETYETYKKRYGSAAANRSASLFSAPESIIVIDPPKDPSFPVRRRLYVFLSGIFAGLLLGAGLVMLAEFLDRTVRHPDQLIALTGVPIIARLPKNDPS